MHLQNGAKKGEVGLESQSGDCGGHQTAVAGLYFESMAQTGVEGTLPGGETQIE